jgi:hypothetical protein
MFVRVQYTNLSSFYCIEACAWGNLTARLILFKFYNDERDRYFAFNPSSNAVELQTLHKNRQNLPQYNKRSEAIRRNSTTQEYTQGKQGIYN